VIDFGMNVQEAVTGPRFHHQWLPDVLEVERGFPETQLARLGTFGWTTETISAFGAADAIVVRYAADGTRTLYGGADPRRETDTAAGY
jgi:gamma-glutamyltranspeptidase/glutathione hydrolase